MEDYIKVGYGTLFDYKTSGSRPRWRGTLTINTEKPYKIPLAGWVKKTKDGSPYISLSASVPAVIRPELDEIDDAIYKEFLAEDWE